jgi:hypothetical protein
LNKAASSFAKGGVVECSSRVRRKSHARFLEGWARVTAPGYSAERSKLSDVLPHQHYPRRQGGEVTDRPGAL